MKLLVLCLALVGSAIAMPIDDVSPQTSPDQPIALPALDAKSAAEPSETSAAQPKTAETSPSQDKLKAADSTEPIKDVKVEDSKQSNNPVSSDVTQVPASSARSEMPNVPDTTFVQPETSEKTSDNQNQETKRGAEQESQSKSAEADSKANQSSESVQQDDLKKLPSMNIADATSKLVAIAEDNIPPALKSGLIPTPEKKIDIVPQPANTQSEPSQPELNGKSEEVETQEKREAESKPASEVKVEQAKIENPVVAEEPKVAKIDEGKPAKSADIPPAAEEISQPAATKNEEFNTRKVTIDNPIMSSVIMPAAKLAAAAAASMPLGGPVAGFIDDTIRVVRDTVEEIKSESDAPKIENSSPVSAVVPAVAQEETVLSKTEDVSKKLDSVESTESKDEDSGASRRANNSSQEDSSEEKEKNAAKADAVPSSSIFPSAAVPAIASDASLPDATKSVATEKTVGPASTASS